MTVHHYFKTWRSVNIEHFKNFESFFKCSHKNHQALWWNWLSWGPPQERKTQSSLELTAPQIAAQINAWQSSSNRHISTSTVQKRLRESGLHGWIATKKPLLKDTNKRKRLAWAKKHEQWILDRWKSDGVGVLCWWHSVICLEFKAHLTSLTTTASHLVSA